MEGVHLILESLLPQLPPVVLKLTKQNSLVLMWTRDSVPQLQAAVGLDWPLVLDIGQVGMGIMRPLPSPLRPQKDPAGTATASEPQLQAAGTATPGFAAVEGVHIGKLVPVLPGLAVVTATRATNTQRVAFICQACTNSESRASNATQAHYSRGCDRGDRRHDCMLRPETNQGRGMRQVRRAECGAARSRLQKRRDRTDKQM